MRYEVLDIKIADSPDALQRYLKLYICEIVSIISIVPTESFDYIGYRKKEEENVGWAYYRVVWKYPK